MKTILSCLLMLSLASLGAFACSGNPGPSCTEVCVKMVSCQVETSQNECETMCEDMKPLMRSSVWSYLGDCYMETDCATLAANDDVCFAGAISAAPAGAADGLISDLCDKMVSCDQSGTLTKPDCVAEMSGSGGDSLEMIGMFKDSLLDCMGDCVGGVACEDVEDSFSTCSLQCGLSIFSDDG